jgi:hypothetical protein
MQSDDLPRIGKARQGSDEIFLEFRPESGDREIHAVDAGRREA